MNFQSVEKSVHAKSTLGSYKQKLYILRGKYVEVDFANKSQSSAITLTTELYLSFHPIEPK